MVLRGWIRVFQVLARELRRLGIISRIYLLYELEVLPVILCHHLKQNWTISSFLLFVAVVCSEEWPMSLLLLKRLANLFEGTLRIRKGVQSKSDDNFMVNLKCEPFSPSLQIHSLPLLH
ncbi:uncharacterized protein LOC107626673 isoform X2 [Arachis ipaensis]|uniref:uncharacterized protein LOC107626673 isoform X2 n=1 Tax=Arachis ipaensis TaxID=130454 RepID=UPI000A2B2619|nr:uncharacterized protein LOC107626673 isoform X2 [Arachis ipaensis]XP_025631751.1 uncharacterized protein LOC112726541 isoform X3 [Arachis hypogaea]